MDFGTNFTWTHVSGTSFTPKYSVNYDFLCQESVVFHSSLTTQQSNSLERCQAVQERYVSYSAALEMTGLDRLSDRRLARCLDFSVKCTKDSSNSRFFPRNKNLGNYPDTRGGDQFKVNFGRTKQYKEIARGYSMSTGERQKRAGGLEGRAGGRRAGGQGRGKEGMREISLDKYLTFI